MPNYNFKCLKCGHEFQALLPAGHTEYQCLECGHPKTKKLLTAPGVHFKGGGFYKTDSRALPADLRAVACRQPKIPDTPAPTTTPMPTSKPELKKKV